MEGEARRRGAKPHEDGVGRRSLGLLALLARAAHARRTDAGVADAERSWMDSESQRQLDMLRQHRAERQREARERTASKLALRADMQQKAQEQRRREAERQARRVQERRQIRLEIRHHRRLHSGEGQAR